MTTVNSLPNVRVVMVHTTDPGNIGAAARAMKTMGIMELVLVSPQCEVDEKARSRATSALDVLESARVVPTLEDAIADCALAIGTSAKSRHLPWPMLETRELGATVHQTLPQPVALIFGRERDGLTNEELALCDYHIQIPTHPDCRCLNVAQTVQVLCYEIMMHRHVPESIEAEPLATHEETELFYAHLFETLQAVNFLDENNPRKLIPRLRRLFTKARLTQNEVNILRGVLRNIS